jgi:hypothetical protein
MKHRWKILIVLAVALAVVCLMAVGHHYQLSWATEAYIAQLKAQGEPMDLAQVMPPPVPPEQNSADTLRQAVYLMKKNDRWWGANSIGGMKMVAPGKAMVLWQQPDVRDDLVTNSWQNIGAALDQDKEPITLLQQITGKPDFDFSINYNAGFVDFSITNLYLIESKRAARILQGAAIYDAHNGDTASAVENIRALLAITQALRDERFIISELVRIAIAQIAVPANWELLQATNLTDEQLAELQKSWGNLDFIQSTEDALPMERFNAQLTIAEWRKSDSSLEHYLEMGPLGLPTDETFWDRVTQKPEIFMWRYWWSYPDDLRTLKGYEVMMGTLRSAQTNGSFSEATPQHQDDALRKLTVPKTGNNSDISFPAKPDLHTMLSDDVFVISSFIRRVMVVETAKRTVITAIALKRYQLKHGNYPPDLDALVPEFLAAVPLDPVDGQPLRYRLNADGTFLLYSVGPNAQDDGGNPALEKGVEGSNFYWLNPHSLDWVWPQPATAEEIENYYAHPPK